ncbi:helix-turn-helix domain-containing protein [Floricoccus penangensis]|uniref:helix-turn-helix domain-containing protein n=1 Tax=Floricoccus penangensis TaxID=1859475 RepID=UPI00203FC977|nr:helix-turn-helix transcriptional regulator [Floricoccus penangensis]URZ87469.1 helix-turn-helix domain-containing protein [Floricoccus penangensis]
MKIGQIIKEERTHRELTQEDMANEFFVTRQLISKWENDKSYPDLEQVVKISEYFDLPLDYLLKEDKKMVNELNFDSKKKKWMKYLIYFLITLSFYLVVSFFLISFYDGASLTKKDIEITKIEKILLPEKKLKNSKTGEELTLPEDIEYTIYFKTNKAFVDLSDVYGSQLYTNEEKIVTQINTGRKIFGKKIKEGKIYIRSNRGLLSEYNFEGDNTNINKDIYLYDPYKTNKHIDWENIPSYADIIVSKEELNKLPLSKNKS